MERIILHSDCNSFYASVECLHHPEIREKPVAVGGDIEQRHGIILAKNQLAKQFHVSTGEAIWQAKQKCPDLVVVPPHYEEYLKYSKLAKAIYCDYTNQVEPYGMDKCWLDISGTKKLFGNPVDVANEIRERIKFELGLTISVGVSFNKIFAKLGSDYKKPDAVTVFEKETFREKIWSLPASDLLGVGRATTRVLNNYCIRTIGDLANSDYDFIKRILGKNGVSLWLYANGRDNSTVKDIKFVSPVKSIGHGITTVVDLSNEEEVWRVFLELTQGNGHKLRVHQKVAKAVAIYVRDNTLFSKQWQTQMQMVTQLPLVLAQYAFQLFKKRYDWRNPIRSVTIQAINLFPQDMPQQIDLFCDYERAEKQEKLDGCVEKLCQRFGKRCIRNAVLLQELGMPMGNVEITVPTGLVK